MNRKPTNVIFYFCFEGFSRLGNINNHIRETIGWLAKFDNKKVTVSEITKTHFHEIS